MQRGVNMHNRVLQVCIVTIGALLTTGALAASETWVSGVGNDAGNCAITSPCRTFAFAAGITVTGGTINVLSSGSYGPVTITKSVSIIADGVEAIIDTAALGSAIRIQAPNSHVVVLRGLTIHGVSGNDAIRFISGGALDVQKSVIIGGANGINFAPTTNVARLSVSDTTIANTTSVGLWVVPSGSGGAQVAIDRVRVEHSGAEGFEFTGVNGTGSIKATLRDCVSSGNATTGIRSDQDSSGTVVVMVDRCASINNGTGIDSEGPGSTIRIGDSVVTGNGVGLNSGFGATLASYGTNKINGNGSDGAPTVTISLK